MKNKKELDNILEECLERIIAGGATIEWCLTNYPEQAEELKPLLEMSLATKNALAIKPRPEFRDRARHQLRMALLEMAEKKESRASLFGFLTPRWATAVAAFLVILLAGTGTVAAAGNSMPDQTLYPVKLATERVRLVLTLSDLGKAELYAALADKRVAEIVRMAEKGKPEQVARTARKLNDHLEWIISLALPSAEGAEILLAPALPAAREAPAPSLELAPAEKEAGVMLAPAPRAEAEEILPVPDEVVRPEVQDETDKQAKLRAIIVRNAARHSAVMREVLERIPESARPALRQAIANSNAEYEKVLRILRERKGRN